MSGDVIRGLGIEIDLSGDADEELRNWIKGLKEARGGADGFAGSIGTMEREMIAAAQKIGLGKDQLKDLVDQTRRTGELKDFGDKYGIALSDIQQKTRKATDEMQGFGTVVNGFLAMGILAKVGGAAKGMVELAASAEQTAISFEVMLGSAYKAKEVLKQLDTFSIVTPFEPKEVNEAAKVLLQFNVKAENLLPIMQKVGDVASGTGKNFGDLARMVGRVHALNKADNELLQQVPVMYGALAKVLKVSEKQVFDMASSGQIGFKQVEQALKQMTEKGGIFYGMMDKQSRSFNGLMSTLKGNIDGVKKTIGNMIMDGLKPVIDYLGEFTGWLLKNETAMAVLKTAVLIITPAVGILFAGAVVKAARALDIFRLASMKALLPWIALAAAILAVIIVIEDLYVWIKGGNSLIGGWLEKTFGFKPKAFIDGITAIQAKLAKFFEPIIKEMGPFWQKFSSLLREVGSLIVLIGGYVWEVIKFLSPLFEFLFKVVGVVLIGILEGVVHIVSGAIKAIGWIAREDRENHQRCHRGLKAEI